MAYDVMRRQIVLFGGLSVDGKYLNDTWIWDGRSWKAVNPPVSPPARGINVAVYDAARGEILLSMNTETWGWNGSTWALKGGHPRGSFSVYAMAYDAGRREVILFGGNDSIVNYEHTFVWDGQQWIEEAPPTRPPARSCHAMAYDEARNQVVLFGGGPFCAPRFNDTWTWNGNTWTKQNPPVSPPPVAGHSMAYDAARREVILYGGGREETWAWDGTTWARRYPPEDLCPPFLSAYTPPFPREGGTGYVYVTQGSCFFAASTSSHWVSLLDGENWSGAMLPYSVAPNPDILPRTGTISVTGNTIRIIQTGATPASSFVDASDTRGISEYVELLKNRAITQGCESFPARYCPDANATRGQLAVFIIRSILGGDNFPYNSSPYFSDVPSSHLYFRWIQKLKELGITRGCSNTTYCPEEPVTRAQAAVLTIRGRWGDNFNYSRTPYFTDVPPSDPFFPYVQKMRDLGITQGCTSTRYCGGAPTLRWEAAVFVVRAFLMP